MQQHHSGPLNRLYQAATAAPVFTTNSGEPWALLPRGAAARQPVTLSSAAYKAWLHQMSEEKLGLRPGRNLLADVTEARRSDAAFDHAEVALRIHFAPDGGVFHHLGEDDGACLHITSQGWEIAPAPQHTHFRYPETHLPIPRPLHCEPPLEALLAAAFGQENSVPLTQWLVSALNPAEVPGVLLLTGPGRRQAVQSLASILDPRRAATREPRLDDDWLRLYSEFSRFKPVQLDKLNHYAGAMRRPVIVTAAEPEEGLEATALHICEFEPFHAGAVLGALATAVVAAIRAPQKASSSPSRS